MARRTALLALAALALLAGCAGALSAGDSTTYPDGVTETDVNGTAVAQNHATALDGSSRTLSMTINNSMGEVSQEIHVTQKVGTDRENVWLRMNTTGGAQTLYLTADEQYAKYSIDNQIRYDVRERPPDVSSVAPVSSTGEHVVNATLSAGNFTVAGTDERDGTTTTTLTADAFDADADVPEGATDLDATVVVDETGVVRSLDYRLTFEQDGRTATTTVSLDVSAIGSTTVPAPDWRDDANESASDA